MSLSSSRPAAYSCTSDGTVRGRPLNSDAARFLTPASIYTDPENGDVYVADGESRGRNTRIAVMDREGRFLRQWRPEGMAMVHCMTGARDGLVYVCNRYNSRLQVYDQRGRFIRNIEVPWRPYVSGGPKLGDYTPDLTER